MKHRWAWVKRRIVFTPHFQSQQGLRGTARMQACVQCGLRQFRVRRNWPVFDLYVVPLGGMMRSVTHIPECAGVPPVDTALMGS